MIQPGENRSPTRAMVLAAGLGTRLRPLTDTVPKCMVPVAGRPLVEHTIRRLRASGVTHVVLNQHHLAEKVRAYFGDGSRWDMRIDYSYEPTLLGTAGAVKKVEQYFDEPFFVWYGDNLSRCNLRRLWERHRTAGAEVTMALHHRDDPTQSGIVGLDDAGYVTRFLEKPRPEQVFSHWVNAGILVVNPSVLARIPSGRACDFSREVFPAMLESGAPIATYPLSDEEGLWWVDSPADLERVQQLDLDPETLSGATT